MSSSRSIAGARQRRGGEAPPPPPPTPVNSRPQVYNQGPGQGQNQNPGGKNPEPGKLSVSNAFALVTIRLGRLETIVNKLQTGEVGVVEHDASARIVDDSVIKSIVSRLEQLEKKNTGQTHTSDLTNETKSLQNEIKSLHDRTAKELALIKKEMAEIKNYTLQMQSFTMQTNQKLCDVIFQKEGKEEKEGKEDKENQYDDENTVYVYEEEQEQEHYDESVSEDDEVSLNLKELVEKELVVNYNETLYP